MTAGKSIANLLAAGEVTGLGGINGKAALEGTFLGPGALRGKNCRTSDCPGQSNRSLSPWRTVSAAASCHDVKTDDAKNRSANWHYEQPHRKVLDRGYECAQCHSDLHRHDKIRHRLDRLALTSHCGTCHAASRAIIRLLPLVSSGRVRRLRLRPWFCGWCRALPQGARRR